MPPKPLLVALGLIIVPLLGAISWQYYNFRPSYTAGEPFVPPFGLSNLPGLMPIIVSLVLLIAALWVILARRYTPTDRHWAYGAVGTIVGFWLHS